MPKAKQIFRHSGALQHQYGLYTGVSLLYAASLIWAIGVGVKRKKMGEFELPDYR